MPTPEQQHKYARLSGQLMAIGTKHYKELPSGTVSLSLIVSGGIVGLEAYDRLGKLVGVVPNAITSSAFRSDLERVFARAAMPDEPIIAIVNNPMTAKDA